MTTRNTLSLRTLAGALMLSAGFASSLALADEGAKDAKPDSTSDTPLTSASSDSDQNTQRGADSGDEKNDADYVKVRISLPDGRIITRLEPKHNISARYNTRVSAPTGASGSRNGGSGVSVGSRSVSGGSNSSSVKASGGGGGGGGSSTSFGGGGGGGGGGSSASGESSAAAESTPESKGGVFSYGNTGSTTSDAGVGQNNANSNASNQRVSSLGSPSYDRDGNATGGQRVEFNEAGMSAAVVGNRVYFIGVELVMADQPFEIITGTRVGTDAVITEDTRLSNNGVDPLSSFNTGQSSIKIELEAGAVVNLTMFTPSSDALSPDREQRTWTVRIR